MTTDVGTAGLASGPRLPVLTELADAKIGVEVFESDDAKIGPRASMERRSPLFTGR
jgi:hypothetical protein